MSKEIQKWSDRAMFAAEPMKTSTPSVYLVSATPDPLGSIAAACRMYEGKPTYSLDDVTDDERRHYWEQVKLTHLKAPLEFVDLHFFIEGVTRAFTHQMVRQRTAVYAQESLRFAVKEDLAHEIAPPPSLIEVEPGQPDSPEFWSKEQRQLDLWTRTVAEVSEAYEQLVNTGVPAEDARGLLPHATTTRLNYKTNLRNLLDHAGNRLCTQAQFEWRWVFAGIVRAIRTHDVEPVHNALPDGQSARWQWELIAGDDVFKPVCYKMGRCPFKADFDRGCTIRERVDAGKFDEIDDREWMMDPSAGVVR